MWFGEIPPFANVRSDALVPMTLDRPPPTLKRRPVLLVSARTTRGTRGVMALHQSRPIVPFQPKSNLPCLWMLMAFGSYKKAVGLYL